MPEREQHGARDRQASLPRFLTPILLGMWFGIVAGLLEALARLAMKLLAGDATHLGAYLAWMPAAANGMLFAGIGGLFAVVAVVLPRLGGPRLWLAVFSFLCALDVLWVWSPPMTFSAVALLSGGIAFQVTRTVAPRFVGVRRLIGWSTPALVLILVLTAVGIEAWRVGRERRMAAVPAMAGQPNVLLLVLDTVRSLNLGTYGYFRATTPTLSALAERGVLFERTITVSSWTLPSHAAMFTGRWTHEQGTGWEKALDDRWPTVAEELGKRGYASGGFVGNLGYCDREFGLSRGFAHYEDYDLTWRQAMRSSRLGFWLSRQPRVDRRFGPGAEWTRKHAGQLTRNFLDWEAKQDPNRPWFGFINFFDAHREYWSPREYRTLFAGDSARAPAVPHRLPPQDAGGRYGSKAPIADYDRAIRYTDDEIGKLLAELERRGALRNTVVIITSDHGEEFEEHGFIGHGNSLYLPSLSVPLVIAFPGRIPGNVRVPQVVSNRDLAATMMALVDTTGRSPFPGASLARFWQPNPPAMADTVVAELGYAWGKPSWLPVSKGDMASAFHGTRHLIRGGDGRFELFDIGADWWEQTDFYGDSMAQPVTAGLRQMIEALPKPDSTHRPPPAGRDQVAPGDE